MIDILREAHNLTPIENYNGVLYKRDDLFQPFQDEMLNGGKVRQAINLIHHNLDLIRTEYHGKVATSCQKDSPQGLIVSRVAREFNLGCFVGYGQVSLKTIQENKLMNQIRLNGGEVANIADIAYDNVVTSHLKSLQTKGAGNQFFIIKFGIDVDKNPIVVDCISEQVKNLPDDLVNLVIPTGSGITAGSILKGLDKYNKKIRHIHVVHISGEDRQEKINHIAGHDNFEYIKGTGYKYGKKVKVTVSEGFILDEIYEAKAHDWMMHNIDIKREKTLFWVVGNANSYR